MSATSPHPSPEALAACALGRLDDDELARISEHLAACPTCRSAVATVPPDDFLSALRQAADADTDWGETGPPPAPAEVPPELAEHERYRVVELIGKGGMGTVYRAEHRRMNRPVAIKVLERALLNGPGAVERFQREVRAAAKLNHPNIVLAFDADRAGELHFLVMELVPGVTLSKLVRERGPLPVAEACGYVQQAALGLQHALECGLVHRDVKPANLVVTPEGQVKVLDFGLARFVREGGPTGELTETGVVMGTADYMAPEQAGDPHAADVRADVYSLGCVLYFLLTGQPPFPEGTFAQKLRAHEGRQPRPVTAFRGDVPAGLALVLERMMAKDVAQRYQAPREVVGALAPFLRPPVPPRRRRWRVALALTATAFLLLLGGTYYIATDKGTVELVTDDEEVEVTIKRGGKTVVIFDPTTGRSIELRSGEYLVELGGKGEGLRLSTDRLKVRRGRKTIVEVRRVAPIVKEPPAAKAPPGEKAPFVRQFEGHTAMVFDVAFSPDGKLAATAGWDWVACLWEVETGKLMRRFRGHRDRRVNAVAFSPNGKRLLTCGSDHVVRLWNVNDEKEVRSLEGHTDCVNAVRFLPDGRRALSCSNDRTVRLWDVDTGKELKRFEGHAERIRGLALSKDGRLALSGSDDRTIRLWEVKSGKELRRFAGPGSAVDRVAFTPNGHRALSASHDGTVRLWDVATGRELRVFRGHTDRIEGMGLSADGRRAVSGGWDWSLRVWDVPAAREVGLLEGKQANIAVAVSPDGRYALSSDHLPSVRLWRLPPLRPVEPRPEEAPVAWPAEDLRQGKIAAPDLSRARPLYQARLDDPASGWPTWKNQNVALGYATGKYSIALQPGWRWFIRQSKELNLSNFACEVIGRVTRHPQHAWEVWIATQKSPRGLLVRLNGQGAVTILAADGDGRPALGSALPVLERPWIARGAAFNKLLVIIRGRLLEVYVNGKAVCDPVVLDWDVTPAHVLLGCQAPHRGERAEFERFTVWPADGLPLPAARGAVKKGPPVPLDLKGQRPVLDLDFQAPGAARGKVGLGERNEAKMAVVDGEYQILRPPAGWSWGGPEDNLGAVGDFVFEAEGRLVSGAEEGAWGMLWGHAHLHYYQALLVRQVGHVRQLSLVVAGARRCRGSTCRSCGRSPSSTRSAWRPAGRSCASSSTARTSSTTTATPGCDREPWHCCRRPATRRQTLASDDFGCGAPGLAPARRPGQRGGRCTRPTSASRWRSFPPRRGSAAMKRGCSSWRRRRAPRSRWAAVLPRRCATSTRRSQDGRR